MQRRIRVLALTCVAGLAVTLPATASALTKTVYAGPGPGSGQLSKAFNKRYSPDVNDYFLHTVTINKGDAIKWIINGAPHTVDLPGASGKDLPFIVPGPTVEGDKDAAGNLFWFNGKVPSLGINPAVLGPSGPKSYDGTSRVDSGFSATKPFKVTFTKPGVYKYYCDVHAGMVGYVVVRPKGKPIPSAKQDAAALARQSSRDVATIKSLAKTKAPANHVSLGAAGPNGVELFAMFPAKLHVKRGTVVTFFISKHSRETHTASFGPHAYLGLLANSIQGRSPYQQVWYPSDNPAFGPGLVTPTSHGNGFGNTGTLDQDPTTTAVPASGKLKFTKAGTYHYICLIHPFMHGTIVVK